MIGRHLPLRSGVWTASTQRAPAKRQRPTDGDGRRGVGIWRGHVRAEGGHVARARPKPEGDASGRRRWTAPLAPDGRRSTSADAESRGGRQATQESPPARQTDGLVVAHASGRNFFFSLPFLNAVVSRWPVTWAATSMGGRSPEGRGGEGSPGDKRVRPRDANGLYTCIGP